jgi:transcriptional regulator with XRE-family HTH domain
MKLAQLGMRIRRLREKRGLTQESLAGKTKLSRGFIARLEMGRHDPSLTTLTRLAKALKVRVSELLDE